MSVTSRIENGIATLTIDQPPLNILTRDVLGEFHAALRPLAANRDVRVLVIAAAGRHFSAGADVGEHLPPRYRELIPDFLLTVKALADFPAPVVAVVRGKCLGGGFELIQAADFIVASESAWFGQPEIMLGVAPPVACALLAERCGAALAAELVLTGDPIDAPRALAAGLLSRVVPDERLEAEAATFAQRMARHSGAALRLTKQSLRCGSAVRLAETLAATGALYMNDLMRTHDAVEGLTAFLEKRKPEWTHQ